MSFQSAALNCSSFHWCMQVSGVGNVLVWDCSLQDHAIKQLMCNCFCGLLWCSLVQLFLLLPVLVHHHCTTTFIFLCMEMTKVLNVVSNYILLLAVPCVLQLSCSMLIRLLLLVLISFPPHISQVSAIQFLLLASKRGYSFGWVFSLILVEVKLYKSVLQNNCPEYSNAEFLHSIQGSQLFGLSVCNFFIRIRCCTICVLLLLNWSCKALWKFKLIQQILQRSQPWFAI